MTDVVPGVAPPDPIASLRGEVAQLRAMLAALVQQVQRPAAPASSEDAAFERFMRMQNMARESVQQQYEFTKKLAADAALGQQPGSEWAPIAEAVTKELLPAVGDFIRSKTGAGTDSSDWRGAGQVITVEPVAPSEPAQKTATAEGGSP